MKWWTWPNWLGVFFFITFCFAMLFNSMAMIGAFFLGAMGTMIEMYVQRRIDDGSATIIAKEEFNDGPATP